jgi:hypothetical protein
MAALDSEECAAEVYAALVRRAGRRVRGHDPAEPLVARRVKRGDHGRAA